MEKVDMKQLGSIAKLEPLDDNNWSTWHQQIIQVLQLGDIFGIVDGQIPKPAAGHTDLGIWNFNDKYAQCLITQSMAKAQMMHIGWLTTSHEIWTALKAIHEPKGHQTAICYGTASCLLSYLINHASPILSNELSNTSVWMLWNSLFI